MATRSFKKFCRKTNIRYIKPLFMISKCLALVPSYNFQKAKLDSSLWYKCYVLFFLAFLIAGFSYSLVGKIYYVFPSMETTILVVNVLASISFFVINVTSVLSINFWNRKKLESFLNNFAAVDRKLAVYNERVKSSNGLFYFELFLNHASIIFMVIYDCLVWTFIIGLEKQKYQLYENFQKYHTQLLVQIMCNFVICIKHRYKTLNNLLVEIVSKRGAVTLSSKVPFNPVVNNKESISVKNIVKMFTIVNETVSLFNQMYGWTILFLNINIIASFLVSLDFIIEYTSDSNILKDEYGIGFIILMLLWTLLALTLGVAIASTCDKATKEAQRTSTISYKLLQVIPNSSSNSEDREVRDDLLLLSEQTSLRSPCFSAAGFFSVDYTMLFTLLGSITSYLVVLIQFN